MLKKRGIFLMSLLFCLTLTKTVFAMHIMEGFLSPLWSISWGVVTLPFIAVGLKSINNKLKENPKLKFILAVAAAFTFVLSALKIPSLTGSCSHPTGIGLGAILFGPTAMSVVGLIVLIFQALLLAHGGITTLGANTFSMAVVGSLVAYYTYKLIIKSKGSQGLAVFLAATLGDLATYVVTSIQLAAAYPSATGGFYASLVKFLGVFALTQIPLAISEGLLTVLIFKALKAYNYSELQELKVISEEV